MAEIKNTQTLVIETSDGQVTLEQGEAHALLRALDDSARYFKVTKEVGGVTTKTYYDIRSSACGFCKVATLTYGTAEAEEIACEDPLPNCPEGDNETPTEPDEPGDDDQNDEPSEP